MPRVSQRTDLVVDLNSASDLSTLHTRLRTLRHLKLRVAPEVTIWLSDLGDLGVAAPCLVSLELEGFLTPDDCGGSLAKFTGLEELTIPWTHRDTKVFPALPPSLKRLTILGLDGHMIKLQLRQCPLLQELTLYDLVVCDDFSSLPRCLRVLDMELCDLDPGALATVPTTMLRRLALARCTVTCNEDGQYWQEEVDAHLPPLPPCVIVEM